MEKCIELAKSGRGFVTPNPMVGAILTNGKGEIVSSGAHLKFGGNHAEVNCINAYGANSKDFSNLTLYVNLEPCSHFGKTPPCVDLIIQKGIKKVVIAMADPNPKVSEEGIEKLGNAGVEVTVGVLENEAKELNCIYIKNITTGKPYIAIKTAVTLDGKIATLNGSSKWITSESARNEVQRMRGNFDAVMSGSGTILKDNPNLNCRIEGQKSPIRIIFDRDAKIETSANVFKDDGAKKIWVTNKNPKIPKDTEILSFKNFDSLFKDLYKMGIYSILVEAGSALNSAVINAQEADFLYQFVAPKILGRGLGFVDGIEVEDINLAQKLENVEIYSYPPDILLTGKFVYNDCNSMGNNL